MNAALNNFYACLSTGISLATAHLFIAFFIQPTWWVNLPREGRWRPWWNACASYAYYLAVVMGSAFMFYKGIVSAFWWVPSNWAVANEDGQGTWVIYAIAAVVAVICSFLMVGRMEEMTVQKLRNENMM